MTITELNKHLKMSKLKNGKWILKMNISAETSVKYNSEDYDSSYDYDFFGEPFDFRIKELLKPEVG